MGYVEDLPSGRYRGIPWNAAAHKRGKSAAFDHWEQADAYWRRAEAEMDGHYTSAGVEVTRQQRDVPLFADHVVAWARKGIPNGEVGTLRQYRSCAAILARRWPTERTDEITEQMALDYLTDLRDARMAPSTRTNRLVVLRHAMRAAVRAKYRPDDPTLDIKAPAPVEHDATILTDPELMLILCCLPGWLWPAALLSHDAGPRISEVAGLRMCNLDLLRGVVTIADQIDVDNRLRTYTKNKQIRNVPLSERCLTALRQHVETYPPAGKLGHVFTRPGKSGAHLLPRAIRYEWDRALLLASLDGAKATWHDLRHGCATGLAEAGVDIFVIAEILGHSSIRTTQRYVRRASLARQAEAIARTFGPREGGDESREAQAGG